MRLIEELKQFDNIKKESGSNNKHNVQLITISTCIWCQRLKTFLSENSIEYEYMDIDLLSDREKFRLKQILYKYTPTLSFPMTFINGLLVKGFQREEIARMLEIRS